MIEEPMPPGKEGATCRAFSRWLQLQLKARKLTQRQLAHRSGVDHSTISRLLREDRTPSLHTAHLLARALGVPVDLGMLDRRPSEGDAPVVRVEHALRSDHLLSELEVRRIMNVYLTARLRRAPTVVSRVILERAESTSVPLVPHVAGAGPR